MKSPVEEGETSYTLFSLSPWNSAAIPSTVLFFPFYCWNYLLHFQIYDGRNSSAPLLNKLCGNTIPSSILTGGRNLYMRFLSDATGIGNGFRAVYQTVGVGKETFTVILKIILYSTSIYSHTSLLINLMASYITVAKCFTAR